MDPLVAVVAIIGSVLAIALWTRFARSRRENFIRHAEFPKGLFEQLRKRHPTMSLKECQLVAHGLRQFFLAHLISGRKFVSMPSQVVDDLWHEFILYTKNYEAFCRKAFGQFLHHTPAAVLSGSLKKNEGLRRCWWHACREENIDPRSPTRLPLLFALDGKLCIAGGFTYVPDCKGVRRKGAARDGSSPHCGADFSSDFFDGSTDGFDGGGSDGSGSDGCGGGGCGGGD